MSVFDFASGNIKSRGIYEETCHLSKTAALRGFFSVGAYSFIGERCWITNCLIGKFSWIENGVEIGSKKIFSDAFSNHPFALSEGNFLFQNEEFSKLTTDRFFYHKQPLVYIGNDVKICRGSIVFSGVTIGDGALVLPNTVVYEDVEPYSIVAGNPAKKIGSRFSKEIECQVVESRWVDLDFSELKKNKRKNYLDVTFFLREIKTSSLKKRIDKNKIYSGILNSDSSIVSTVAIQGPSHVQKWVNHIEAVEINNSSGHVMYGEAGLSIFSKSFRNFEKWWLSLESNKMVFFVPDFRIGNSGFLDEKIRSDGVFIYDNNINSIKDGEIYYKALE